MQSLIFSGSLLSAASVQPPVPVERWSAVGPGIAEASHLANSSGGIASLSWKFCQWPPMNIAGVPATTAALKSS